MVSIWRKNLCLILNLLLIGGHIVNRSMATFPIAQVLPHTSGHISSSIFQESNTLYMNVSLCIFAETDEKVPS